VSFHSFSGASCFYFSSAEEFVAAAAGVCDEFECFEVTSVCV
jgi:hypothetical protein